MQAIIDDFRQGKLQIDFLDLALIQDKAEKPISYKGKGYLRQMEDDRLIVRLYAVETTNTDMASDFNSFNRGKSGTLYDETDYYSLTGTAPDGWTWTAKQLLPRCSWSFASANPIVEATVSHCERGSNVAGPKALRVHYFDKTDLPSLTDEATFQACGLEFYLKKDEGGFTVKVSNNAALAEHMVTKIDEALRFVLAASLTYRVIESPNNLHLFSRSGPRHQTHLYPPISRGGPAFRSHSWRLFETYLSFVMRDAGPYWHQCSNHLHNACEASANALDAWAIGLGVAVEGLASLLPRQLDPDAVKQLNALQTFINGHVSGSPEYKEFAPRIAGMMNGLTQIRAVDRMSAFALNGGTAAALVDDWKKLRNRGVHPTNRGGDIAPAKLQQMLDEVHHVTVLMYHIVFALIGYTGPYTDYGVHGFPERHYPPAAATIPPDTPSTKTDSTTNPEVAPDGPTHETTVSDLAQDSSNADC